MNYYQVKVSIETVQLLEYMREYYEKKFVVQFSKGNVISSALKDSEWVSNIKDWGSILDTKVDIRKIPVTENQKMLKLQISKADEEFIKELKEKLAIEWNQRNVTSGVCINLILKAAYIKNFSIEVSTNFDTQEFYSKFKKIMGTKRSETLHDLESGYAINVLSLIDDIEKELELLFIEEDA